MQGLPGDGRDHAGACKFPQNNPWAWSIAPVKNYFVHFQLQILPSYAFKFHKM
jgi:hypothetical protein